MLYDIPTRHTEPARASRSLVLGGATALAALALLHLAQIPEEWEESRLIGAEFVLLVAAAGILAATLLRRRGGWIIWALSGALASATAVAFVLSRTTGIPGDHADVGAWSASGVTSLVVEAVTIVLAVVAVRRHRSPHP